MNERLKQSLHRLYQKGSVTDETLERMKADGTLTDSDIAEITVVEVDETEALRQYYEDTKAVLP